MSLFRIALVLGSLALVATGAPAQSAKAADAAKAATREAPGEAELEYWRSAQRIDTVAAYRAYLDSFPSGFFAGLARLKLATPPAAAPAKATDAPMPQAAVSNATLRNFSEPLANSSAVSLNLGDRLNGPGLVTVGGVGTRKQIVLPPGEWILLAATDRKSVQLTSPNARDAAIGITTLVFGRFTGERLASLIRVTSNRQVANVAFWTDLEACDRSQGPSGLAHAKTRDGLRDECNALRVEANPVGGIFSGSDEFKASLARLGATVSGTGLVSTLTLGDSRFGYLGVTRIDWPGTALGAAADRVASWRAPGVDKYAAHQSYLKRLGEWSQAYRKLAADGFRRSFDSPDLVANVPARPNAELAGLADFDASAALARN